MYHDFIWDHCWYVSMFSSFCIFVPNYGRNSTKKKNHIEFSCSIFMSFSISDVNLVKHYFSLFGFVWYKSTFDVSGRRSVRPAVCPSVWLSMKILWWNFNVDKNILTKIVWKQKNLLDISCIILFIPISMICGFSFVFDIEGKNK